MNALSPAFSFRDPYLHNSFPLHCNLSIRIFPDGFTFCILDIPNNRFIVLESFQFPGDPSIPAGFISLPYIRFLNQILKTQHLLSDNYHAVNVLIGATNYTLVPQSLFDPEHSESILQFNHPSGENEKVVSDKLDALDIVLVYAIPVVLSDWISSCFPGSGRYHIAGNLIRHLYSSFRSDKHSIRVFLNIRAASFDAIILMNGNLHFCNSFSYNTPQDLLYYVLFICEQLQLDTDVLLLHLMGNLDWKSEVMTLLSQYIRHIEFMPVNKHFSYSHTFEAASLHRFYDLLNTSL